MTRYGYNTLTKGHVSEQDLAETTVNRLKLLACI